MSGELVKQTRNIFIDSETNTNIDYTTVSVNLIPQDFSCSQDEQMRMTLTTFEMRNNWYNININNNTFYIFTPTSAGSASGTYYQVTIAQGSYVDFVDTIYNPGIGSPITQTGLATAIASALNTTDSSPSSQYTSGTYPSIGTGHTVSYNVVTRQFSITLNISGTGNNGTLTANSYPVFFCVPNGNNLTDPPPSNVYSFGYFSDCYEIAGSAVNKTYSSSVAPTAMNNTGVYPYNVNSPNSTTSSTSTWTSPFVGQLNSNEALYLRTNLQSANYSTYGFAQSIYQNAITPSNIFARIPLQNQIYNVSDPFIVFEDKNDPFIIDIGNKQLDQLTLMLTDDKNRPIPLVANGQVTNGSLSFKLTIKWEVLLRDQANPFIPNVNDLTLKFRGAPRNP